MRRHFTASTIDNRGQYRLASTLWTSSMIRALVSQRTLQSRFSALPARYRVSLFSNNTWLGRGALDEACDVRNVVPGAMRPCPILRIVSFQIHPVSFLIHLPLFLFNCSSIHMVKPSCFRKITRHPSCSA